MNFSELSNPESRPKRSLGEFNTSPEEVILSLVVPVYNEAANIRSFCERVQNVLVNNNVSSFEFVFVDDGSVDNTWEAIRSAFDLGFNITALRLARNVGKEVALYAGLANSHGRIHVPIDVDLQDPPEVILEMIDLWTAGANVVLARRRSREDSYLKSKSANLYYRLISFGSRGNVPPNVGDFRLMDSKITARYLLFGENSRYNKGLFSLVASEIDYVDFDRPRGRAGDKSRQSPIRLIELAADGIFSFTTLPLRFVSLLGAIMILISILGVLLSVLLYLTGVLAVPGQTTVIVMVLFAMGFQALSLGIVGEYVSRILIEVRNRPSYFISETIEGR